MIITAPNKILTTPAKKVLKVDRQVIKVVDKMKKALLGADKPKGVGLAASQIDIALRIFVTKPTSKAKIRVFINPQIIFQSEKKKYLKRHPEAVKTPQQEKRLEGCLSIPNVWGKLKRPDKVKLKYMDLSGKIREEEFSGFMATIVQHETDHVNGILFTQKVLEQGEKLYRLERDDKDKEKLVEIKI